MPARPGLRTRFQEELRGLEDQTLGALDMVVSTLDRALEALKHQDVELASIVIHDDDRLDGRFLEVHQGILSLLALQAPVAGDLRVVAALLHVIKHVERMGDQCVNIAKLIPLSGYEAPTDPEMIEIIERMGALAKSQVGQARVTAGERLLGLHHLGTHTLTHLVDARNDAVVDRRLVPRQRDQLGDVHALVAHALDVVDDVQ